MKSSKKLRRATKSNNGHQSWKKPKRARKNEDEQRKAQKSKLKSGFTRKRIKITKTKNGTFFRDSTGWINNLN